MEKQAANEIEITYTEKEIDEMIDLAMENGDTFDEACVRVSKVTGVAVWEIRMGS